MPNILIANHRQLKSEKLLIMKKKSEFIEFKDYIWEKEDIFNSIGQRARNVVDVLVAHVRDKDPGDELERIANLCNDEAIKVSLLEILEIARKQRELTTIKEKK